MMTTNENSEQPDKRLDQQTASRILQRLAELDRKSGISVSIMDLRAAALEAGFAPQVFDEAVQDVLSGTAVMNNVQEKQESWFSRLKKRVAGLIVPSSIALAFGAGAGFLMGRVFNLQTPGGDNDTFVNIANTIAWAQLIAASIYLAIRNRPRKNVLAFLIQNSALWVGVYAGLIAILPTYFSTEMLTGYGAFAALSLIITTPIGIAIATIHGRLLGGKSAGPRSRDSAADEVTSASHAFADYDRERPSDGGGGAVLRVRWL